MSPRLRRAVPQDREEIVSLVLRVLIDLDYPSLSPALAAAFAKDPRALVQGPWELAHVATVDDHVRGVVLTGLDVIDDLWLDRSVRRQGLGRALLDIALEEIRARGYAAAKLRVVAANTNAIAFYLHEGFREVGRVANERFGFEMLRMVRGLATAPS